MVAAHLMELTLGFLEITSSQLMRDEKRFTGHSIEMVNAPVVRMSVESRTSMNIQNQNLDLD